MYSYYPELVWKIDKILLILLALLVLSVVIYIFVQELSFRRRRNRLLNVKNNIYEILLKTKEKSVFFSGEGKLTFKQFIDVMSNRFRWIIFFNENEQEEIRKSFITQENIIQIERIAKKSRNKWQRIEAMLALGFAGAPSALVALEKGLFDNDPDISYFSLLALGRLRTDLSLRILLAFLRKNTLRRQKVASIIEFFPPSAADRVIKLTDDREPELCYWALKILSRFKPVKYIQKIKTLSQHYDHSVRAAACECLGNIGGKEAEEVLIKSLKDESWFVRVQAARGLGEAMGENCVGYIAPLLSDNSLNVVEAAGDILTINAEAALPYLEKMLTGDDSLAKRKAIEVLATGGLIEKLICGSLKDNPPGGPHQMKLIAVLIGSGAHYSIESAVLGLGPQERMDMIEKIKSIDGAFGQHLLEKSQGLIKENE
ncbi:MAG: HEAT repeat domain-containing protein [Candidatus Omnitrophica bacterium]|nr:HEAT repeat domain-containing protein [Candidatus Omnitrophota bacterium]